MSERVVPGQPHVQMTVEDCVAEVEAEARAREFKDKLRYWREGGGVPLVLPDSFRAAK